MRADVDLYKSMVPNITYLKIYFFIQKIRKYDCQVKTGSNFLLYENLGAPSLLEAVRDRLVHCISRCVNALGNTERE